MNTRVRMNQPLISENMRESYLTGIHVWMTSLRPKFAWGEVCNINRLPGGEAFSGHVFEYAIVNSSMKEELLVSREASMRLREFEDVFEALDMVDMRGRLSPATRGR